MKKIISLAKIIPVMLLVGILLAASVPIKSKALAGIILRPFEKKLHKQIEFSESRIWLPGNISFMDAAIVDESGRLYYCRSFDLKYSLFGLLFKNRELVFDLKDVRLYQHIEFFDSVAEMLAISKMPDLEFERMEVVAQFYRNAIYIKDIGIYNDKMRVEGKGLLYNDGSLDCELNFSFSEHVTKPIPDIIKKTLLKKEASGWMGIAFKISGNYKRPSLHITGDVLKLNIRKAIELLDKKL